MILTFNSSVSCFGTKYTARFHVNFKKFCENFNNLEVVFVRKCFKNIMSAEGTPNIKFDGNKVPKLDKAQLAFMKLVEEQNFERVSKLKRQRKLNLITAGVLGVSVIGIYAYSMLAVRQEQFLDDFEEPKKVSSSN